MDDTYSMTFFCFTPADLTVLKYTPAEITKQDCNTMNFRGNSGVRRRQRPLFSASPATVTVI